MNPAFDGLVLQLPALLEKLRICPPMKGKPPKDTPLPLRAVYLFSRSDHEHLYVGRTNRLRQRIREHICGRHNDAPFAFKMARHATGMVKAKGGPTRKMLEADETFLAAFSQAKDDVGQLDWRWVEIEDPNLQCLFEIYATLALGAQFNDFENH